jgi:hypothetical protein
MNHAQSSRHDDGNAFFPDPGEGPARAPDDLAESLAEEFLEAATTGDVVHEDDSDKASPDLMTEEDTPQTD